MSGGPRTRSLAGFVFLIVMLVAVSVFLYFVSLTLSGGLLGLFTSGKRLQLPDKTGNGIEVRLSYEKGSHGVTTFFVHAKNVSGRVLGFVGRVRYWASDGKSRNEEGFLLCLVRPWGRVPWNSYSTGINTAVDSLVGPIQPGQEMTMEYDMASGDLQRIGNNDVVAGVFYYDMDPMHAPQAPPPMLAAWSNPIKAEPIEWGLDDKGLQVGLQISGGTAVMLARNTSSEPILLKKIPEWSQADDLFRLVVLDYSGMYQPLLPEKQVPWTRPQTQLLDPGETITARYFLTLRDLQKIGNRLLFVVVAPDRISGPSAESNAVPLPAWQRIELNFSWPWIMLWPALGCFLTPLLLSLRRRWRSGQQCAV